MAQTLASVVGAESDDSHREYPGLLSQGIVPESCFRPRRSVTAAAADLARRLRQGRLRRLPPRALLTPEALGRLGLNPVAKVLDL